MAWYSDEQFEMIRDSREKKSIAASSHKQRSHCGKGGRVKFPSDFMSKKELNAMNGECIKYASLKQPMNWEEFKKLPDDLKTEYIKNLRTKFNVPDAELAKMFGVGKDLVYRYFRCYGLCKGKGSGTKARTWNQDGWLLWLHGADPTAVAPSETAIEDVADAVTNETTVENVDEAAVAEILAVIGEVATEVQKELYPEDVNPEVEQHVNNYFRNEAIKEGYSVITKATEMVPEQKGTDDIALAPICTNPYHIMPVIPKKGNMSFEYNDADDALATIKCLLSNAKVNLTISWECV